jgi:serine/threonine-protein kinase
VIRLQVLGRLELYGADGRVLHSVLAQPKRQAVLAYLAIAIPRGYHRRDSLVALLWPESDDEHARGSLSKAVSHLRQSLGSDVLLSRGHAELGLDWHLIWCDAAGFEEALDRGALAEAMALYGGDLLPGFHVDEAPEFHQWLERERARLRARAVQATQLLSERDEASGQLASAVEWARRGSTLEPYDESLVRRVMTLLDRASDRAGALRTYAGFAAHLREALETEPAAETTRLMESIRDRGDVVSPSVAVAPAASPAASATTPPAQTLVARPESSAAARATSSVALPRRFRLAAVAGAVVTVLALAARAIAGRKPAQEIADPKVASVAVLPFAVDSTAGSSARDLGDAMVTLLSERFNHSSAVHAIDSRSIRSIGRSFSVRSTGADSARALLARFHPALVLLGDITRRGDSLVITAALFDSVSSEPVARAAVTGTTSELAKLSSELSWQLLSARPTRREPMWDRSLGVFTTSVPALRSFLAGEQQYIAGHFVDAAREYKAAVDADTAFALAYFYLSRASNWAGDYTMESFAIRRAIEHLDRLSTADQLLVRAWFAYEGGDPVEAERLSRLLVVNELGMGDAWYVLGELRFHWGAPVGWTRAEARDAFERAFAYSQAAETLVHLARLAAADGHSIAVDTLVRGALRFGVDELQSLELRGLRALASGDAADVQRVSAAVGRLPDVGAFSVATQVATYGAEYPGASSFATALRLPRRASYLRTTGAILGAQLAMMRGDEAEAHRQLAAGPDINASRSIEYRAALAIAPFRHVARATLLSLRDTLTKVPHQNILNPLPENFARDGIFAAWHSYLLGVLAVRVGDAAAATRMAAELEARPDDPVRYMGEWIAARVLRAEVLRASGRTAEALAALGEPRALRVLPSSLFYPVAHERFLRAELLRDLGRWTEALRWYDTFPDPGTYDLAYLPAVYSAKGAVYEALGKSAEARRSYQRVVTLLASADPEWTPMIGHARERLSALPR